VRSLEACRSFSTSTHVAIVADRTNSEQLFLQNVSKTSVNEPFSTLTILHMDM